MIINQLFQIGDFISHAGLPLKWKIECDAISKSGWDALACMIMQYNKFLNLITKGEEDE